MADSTKYQASVTAIAELSRIVMALRFPAAPIPPDIHRRLVARAREMLDVYESVCWCGDVDSPPRAALSTGAEFKP